MGPCLLGGDVFANVSARDGRPRAPATLLTLPGKTLLDERFSGPLKPAIGDKSHVASGFSGWRYNIESRAGRWEVCPGGVFTGMENAEHRHPATASYA